MISSTKFRLCLAFALSALLLSCGERIEYFRQISLNGSYHYVGRFPVSQAESQRVNCFKITSFRDRTQQVEYLQAGKLAFSEQGFARQEYQYFDDYVLVSYENQFGLPIIMDDYYTYERYHVNEKGLYDLLEFHDRNFHPTTEGEVRAIQLEADDRGNIVRLQFMDFKGPCTREGVYGVQRKFDAEGHCLEQTFLDQSGKVMVNDEGFATVRYEYDEHGNQKSISYFDMDNNPYEAYDGMATTRWKYDRFGNRVETVYYDRFDNIINATQDIAINTYNFDKAGNMISRAYFDSLRNPAPFDGYVKINLFYNKEGQCSKKVFFKAVGDSIYQDHSVRYLYDNVGNMREERMYDANMKPLERDGIAVHMFGYDGAHNMISYQTFSDEGYLVPFESGIAHVRWTYNTMGEKIETRYFDADGNLKGGNQHEAINKFVYDDCGQIIERSFYDSLEQLIDFDGAAIIKYNYNKAGMLVEEVHIDKNGKIVEEPVITTQL